VKIQKGNKKVEIGKDGSTFEKPGKKVEMGGGGITAEKSDKKIQLGEGGWTVEKPGKKVHLGRGGISLSGSSYGTRDAGASSSSGAGTTSGVISCRSREKVDAPTARSKAALDRLSLPRANARSS
jgi:hypothetical protein